MAVWVWAGVPETTGVPLEDVKWLFEGDPLWIQFVQDAPGGRWVLGERRAMSIEELKRRAEGARGGDDASDEENTPEKRTAVVVVDII